MASRGARWVDLDPTNTTMTGNEHICSRKAAATPVFPPSPALSSARGAECRCRAESVRGVVPMYHHLNYFPLPLIFYAIFAGVLLALFILLQLKLLRYAYLRIGLDSRVAMLVLLGSLIGSYINIPVVAACGGARCIR
jgi:hypothetical protein